MLSRKLLGAGGVSRDLELVFQDAQFNNTDNSFTRGISFADVRKDDLIILSIATRKNSDITYSATNFTKLTDLYVNSTDDTNFAMFSKVADGTETGIDVTTNEVQNNLTIVAIYRNADTSNPIDVTIATNTAIGATLVTSPNVTTVTDNAIIYQVVAAAGQGSSRPLVDFTQPSSTDNFIQNGGLPIKLAACTSVQGTASTTSLNNFGGGTGYSVNTSIAATLAIRLKGISMNVIKVLNGVVSQYSISQLKADNPNVCFPKNISASILSSYDVYEYIDDVEPSYDEDTHEVTYSYVYELDNKWHKVKTVVQLPESQAASNVRDERDSLLQETDWLGASDVVMSDAWTIYRQALRDLPTQDDFPFNVTYPTKPE